MDPVDIYRTDKGDVVVRGEEVLYTNIEPLVTQPLLGRGVELKCISDDEGSVIELPSIESTESGLSLSLIPIEVVDEKTGVPYEDYESALAKAKPLQDAYNEAAQRVRQEHADALLKLMKRLDPDLFNPSPEYEAENDKLGARQKEALEAIEPVPSLLDLLPTSDS